MAGQGYPMVATHDPRLVDDRRDAGQPQRPRRRAATSSRCSTASGRTSSAGWPRGRDRCGSTCPTATSGTATSCAGWPSDPPNMAFFVRSLLSQEVGQTPWRACTSRSSAPASWARRCSPGCSAPVGRAAELLVAESAPERVAELTEKYDVARRRQRRGRREGADTLVLVVKPQDMGAVLAEIAAHMRPGPAGGLPGRRHHHRVPRDAAARGHAGRPGHAQHAGPRRRGHGGDRAGSHCDEAHLAEAEALLRSCGKVIRVPEKQQDAVTAISGSGPAYIFYVVEAMIEAGVLLGLPRATSTELVVQTALRRRDDAPRDRRAPDGAARAGDPPGRYDDGRAARAGRPQGPRGVPGRDGGGARPVRASWPRAPDDVSSRPASHPSGRSWDPGRKRT